MGEYFKAVILLKPIEPLDMIALPFYGVGVIKNTPTELVMRANTENELEDAKKFLQTKKYTL